jgi:ABC-2 type transport system permease protein
VRTLLLLVRQRGRLLWNRVTRGPRRGRRIAGTLFAVVFTVGFVSLAGLNAGQLLDRVAQSDPLAAANALPVLLAGAILLTMVTSLSSAFHHLFLAGDLELLLAAPVPSRSLFGLKVLEIWRDSVHVLLFQGAALYGFGQGLRLPASYYVAALVAGVLLTLMASALGATLTLALARVRFGESILGLSRVLAILLFLPVGVLSVPALGVGRNRVSLVLTQSDINAVADQLRSVGPPPTWSPTTWSAHLLLGDEAATLSLALLLISAATFFSITQLTFEALFPGGWERVRYSTPARSARRGRWGLKASAAPSGPIVGILQKDWRSLARDPRWRTGALVSVVALGLPVMVLFAGDPLARAGHAARFWFGMLPVPYLAYLFGSQQGAATLAYKGRNIALLRAAPVGMGRILVAKVLGGLSLVLLVIWVATIALGLSHEGEPIEMLVALVAATWLAVGATIASVAGASLTADFGTDNPQRRVGCLGTIVTSALSIFFFVTNGALLMWWVMRTVVRVPRPLLGLVTIVDWGLPALALVSVAAICVAARFGIQRVAGWEES